VKYLVLVLSGLAIPAILIYLWLEYGVREYCLGCGKTEKEHDIKNCPTNTTFNKLAVALGLALAAWVMLFLILLPFTVL
jgi:hypothetical protein